MPAENLTPSERQLALIVRALLTMPKILILDEATNAMSSSLERQTHERMLANVVDNSTTIVTVTHRLKNLLYYDRILVVDNGVIVEDDEPRALLCKSMGFFSALWRASEKDA